MWPLWDCAPPQHGNLLLGAKPICQGSGRCSWFFSGIPIIHLWQFMILIWFWCNRHLKKELIKRFASKTSYIEVSMIQSPCCCHVPSSFYQKLALKKTSHDVLLLSTNKNGVHVQLFPAEETTTIQKFHLRFLFKNGSDSTRQIKSDT